MTLGNMKNIVDVLTAAGVPDTEGFAAEHDILYLPWNEMNGDVAAKLEQLHCHWSKDGQCWARFT